MTATVVPLVQEQTKTCNKCGKVKAINLFWHGRPQCRECRNAWRRKNYHEKFKFDEDFRRKKHENTRKYDYNRKYNLTILQVEEMLSNQHGLCANRGCGISIYIGKEKKNDLTKIIAHVDHNHSSGEVRGLLCRNCNWAIGNVGDSVNVLFGLIEYLEKYS